MNTDKITKKGLFKAPFVYKLAAFLTDSLITMKKQNGIEKLAVKISSGDECCTDGEEIIIGSRFPFFHNDRKMGIPEIITLMLGILFHEMGHVIYTHFSSMNMARVHIATGNFWPDNPANFSEKLKDYITRGAHEASMVMTYYRKLQNILEDGRIEYIMLTEQSKYARFAAGLRLKRKIQKAVLPGMEELLAELDSADPEKKPELRQDLMLCAIFQLALYGVIKGETPETLKSAEMRDVAEIAASVTDAVDSVTADDFYRNLNSIFCAIFDSYLLPYFETIKPEEDGVEVRPDGDMTSSEIEKRLSERLGSFGAADVSESHANRKLEEKTSYSKERLAAKKSGKSMSEEENEYSSTSRSTEIERRETFSVWGSSEEAGKVTYTHEDKRAAQELDVEAIQRIETAETENSSLLKTLKGPENMDFGSANDGISWKINRSEGFDNMSAAGIYNSYSGYIQAGKIAAKQIKPFIRPKQENFYEKDRYSGSRINAARLANPNLRYFSKKITMPKSPSLSVCILVDESGSMGGEKISIARASAISLFEMCSALEIPYAVFGHKARRFCVEMNNYCYFGENDDNARYRLLRMNSGGSNRDGAALRYCAELLKSQDADRRLLFVISDGQPAAPGYNGTAAEADIRSVIKEYERFGIKFVAAAIDADKARIQEIYGTERFLDITRLDMLPSEVVSIVRKMLF